jgi:hypothetical protein
LRAAPTQDGQPLPFDDAIPPHMGTSNGGSTARVSGIRIAICNVQNVYQDIQWKESYVRVSRYHRVVGVLPSANARIIQQEDG